jgi:hypothetical protein
MSDAQDRIAEIKRKTEEKRKRLVRTQPTARISLERDSFSAWLFGRGRERGRPWYGGSALSLTACSAGCV